MIEYDQYMFEPVDFHCVAEVRDLISNNHFHNILRLFDVLPNFPFTTSETICDYYLQTLYIRAAEQLNIKFHRIIAL